MDARSPGLASLLLPGCEEAARAPLHWVPLEAEGEEVVEPPPQEEAPQREQAVALPARWDLHALKVSVALTT